MPFAERGHLLHVKPPTTGNVDYDKNSVELSWADPVIPGIILYHGQEYTWRMFIQCDGGDGGEENFRDVHECITGHNIYEYKMTRLNCCYWFRMMIRITPVKQKNRKLQHLEEVLERHGKPLPSNLAKDEPREYWSAFNILASAPDQPKVCGIGRNIALQWIPPKNSPLPKDTLSTVTYIFEKRLNGCEKELNHSNTKIYRHIYKPLVLIEDLLRSTEYMFRIKVSLYHNESAWSKWTNYCTRPPKLNIKYIYANKLLTLNSSMESDQAKEKLKGTHAAVLQAAASEKMDTNENQLALLELPQPLDPFDLLANASLKGKYRIEGKDGDGSWRTIHVINSETNSNSNIYRWNCPRKHHFGDIRVNVSLDLRAIFNDKIISGRTEQAYMKTKKINRFWDVSLPTVFLSDLHSHTYTCIYEEGKELKEAGTNKTSFTEGKWIIRIEWSGLSGVNNDVLNANQVALNPTAFKEITRSNIVNNSVLLRKAHDNSLDTCKEIKIKEASGIKSAIVDAELIDVKNNIVDFTNNLCAISYCTPATNIRRISPWVPILLAPTPKMIISSNGKPLKYIKENPCPFRANVKSDLIGVFCIDSGIEFVKAAIQNGAKNLELFYQVSTYSIVTLKQESVVLLPIPCPNLTKLVSLTEDENNLVVHHKLLKGRRYEVELKVKELRGISTSAKSSKITPASVPNTPSNLKSTPSFFTSTTQNQQAYLSISWDAPDHNGYPISAYSLQVKRIKKNKKEPINNKEWKEIYTGVDHTCADAYTMGKRVVNAIYRIKATNKLGNSTFSKELMVQNVILPHGSLGLEAPGSNNNINNFTSNMKVKVPSKSLITTELPILTTSNLSEPAQPESEGILDIFSIREAIEASIPPPLPDPWDTLGIPEKPYYKTLLEKDGNTNADIQVTRVEYRLNQLQLYEINFTPNYKSDIPVLPSQVAEALGTLVQEDRRYSFSTSQLTEKLLIAFNK